MQFVAPHDKVSRDVTEEDYKVVFDLGKEMYKACQRPYGVHTGALAIAHSQVESEDPMRFFVTAIGDCIVNPVITNHTKHAQMKPEGCLSFPLRKEALVGRHHKIEVEFYTLEEVDAEKGEFSLRKHDMKLKGREAQVWQHEIEHLDGVNVWGLYGEEHSLSHILKGAETLTKTPPLPSSEESENGGGVVDVTPESGEGESDKKK